MGIFDSWGIFSHIEAKHAYTKTDVIELVRLVNTSVVIPMRQEMTNQKRKTIEA